jgi:hypothetical protein
VVDKHRKSPRNFGSYALIEAVNVFLVPSAALVMARPTNLIETLLMAVAIGACAGFLIVGAAYWRAVDQRLRRANRPLLTRVLVFADAVEAPLLLLTGAAIIAFIYAVWLIGWTPPVIAAAVLILLAGLEYVNYYHRQVQYFDRWSDFKGLVSTRRLRPSHMARALAAHRKRSGSTASVSADAGHADSGFPLIQNSSSERRL